MPALASEHARAGLGLTIVDAVARPIDLAAPPASAHDPAVREVRDRRRIGGWLLELSDGVDRGWWGPLPSVVAVHAARLATALAGRRLGGPADVEPRAIDWDRHARAGLGAVARGAVELASWDLLGHRHGLPVWQLWVAEPAVASVAGYATCFGVDPGTATGRRVAHAMADRGVVQKWDALEPGGGAGRRVAAVLAERGGAPYGLDFRGRVDAPAAARVVEALPLRPQWVEEPTAPGHMASVRGVDFACPLAAGEHCYAADDAFVLEAAGYAVWQPDAVFCGGFSCYRVFADRAEVAGAQLLPHGGGLLPALHAAAIGGPVATLEYHLRLEPRRQAHFEEPLTPVDDGLAFAPPSRPGWNGRVVPGGRA